VATNSFNPSADDAERPLEPGTRLGRYQIGRLLGHGGMGAVYEATHVDLKKRVALKTLLKKHASNKESKARFLREGEAASRIRHPNVVDVTDVGLDKGIPFLVMEYLTGENLADLLKKQGPLPLQEAVALILPILSAVAEGHRRGVFHRDLKPQNIFVGNTRAGDPLPKVLDFGISKLKDEGKANQLTEANSFLGTVTYMSPEQARAARSVDGRSDEYSMAVVLYQCVTGVTPHEADNSIELIYKIASGELIPPRTRRPELPQEFEVVLMRALATSPDDRYESVRSFAGALLPFTTADARQLWVREFTGRERPLTPAPPAPGESTLAAIATFTTVTGATTLSGTASEAHTPTRTRRRVPRLPVVLTAGALLTATLAFVLSSALSKRSPTSAQSAALVAPRMATVANAKEALAVEIWAVPTNATIEIDGVVLGKGRTKYTVPPTDESHRLKISAPGFRSLDSSFTYGSLPPSLIELERLGDTRNVATPRPVVPAKVGTKQAAPTGAPSNAKPHPKRGTNNALILE
jgi:eukaryotic-like serine/threonine-protein kinase